VGQTQDWKNRLPSVDGRMVNQGNNEILLDGGIKVVCDSAIESLPVDVNIQAERPHKISTMSQTITSDVIGTDAGQNKPPESNTYP